MNDDCSKFEKGELIKFTSKIYGKTGIIIDINRAEMSGDGGWIAFDYCVLTEEGQLIYTSENSLVKLCSSNHASSNADTKYPSVISPSDHKT